jgi:hypothetical protein
MMAAWGPGDFGTPSFFNKWKVWKASIVALLIALFVTIGYCIHQWPGVENISRWFKGLPEVSVEYEVKK